MYFQKSNALQLVSLSGLTSKQGHDTNSISVKFNLLGKQWKPNFIWKQLQGFRLICAWRFRISLIVTLKLQKDDNGALVCVYCWTSAYLVNHCVGE